MKLSDLLKKIGTQDSQISGSDPDISSIHYSSTDVKPGGLFVAIHGKSVDGHDFIDQAIEKGASAVVVERPVTRDAIIIRHKNTRQALSRLSAEFYGNPCKNLCMIGVTGTNGKTTVTYLVESILLNAGYNVGVIGTINFRYAGQIFENKVTTPESLDLQRILYEMLKKGVTHVIMEVSSHSIALSRVYDCCFDVGVFTNLTQDHLDFHNNIDSYWECKKRLFTEYVGAWPKHENGIAVINCDDPRGKKLFNELQIPKLSTGSSSEYMIWPKKVTHNLSGIKGEILTPNGDFTFLSCLVGNYNLENILSAVGVGAALDIPLDSVKTGIKLLSSVPGRLERIENNKDRYVYVDYAHTPDALENVLKALRSLSSSRIICVFGCGGDRDRDKRPKMGKIASELSDLCVVTSDNPRSESKIEIINQIIAGIKKDNKRTYTSSDIAKGFSESGYVVEPDRKAAINLAVRASKAGDIILIAGKGHETYQEIGNERVDFDDKEVVRLAFAGDDS